MTRRVLLVFLFVSLAFTMRVEAQQTTSLPGVVVLDGAGVPGVTIELRGPVARTTVTDSNGAFRFSDLPPGRYEVTASMSGFATKSLDVNVSLGATQSLTIDLSPDPVTPPATGSLAGTVTSGGSPVVGALVRIRPVNSTESVTQETGDDGTWEQDELAPGSYVVTVSATDYVTQSKNAVVRNGRTTPVDFSLRRQR